VAVYLATQHYKRDVDRKRHEAGLLMAGLPASPDEAPARNALDGADRLRRRSDRIEMLFAAATNLFLARLRRPDTLSNVRFQG
jgi:hypothetical protein